MTNVHDITEGMPHMVSEVICVNCYDRYLYVRKSDTWLKDEVCPKCGMKGTIINTGQELEEE